MGVGAVVVLVARRHDQQPELADSRLRPISCPSCVPRHPHRHRQAVSPGENDEPRPPRQVDRIDGMRDRLGAEEIGPSIRREEDEGIEFTARVQGQGDRRLSLIDPLASVPAGKTVVDRRIGKRAGGRKVPCLRQGDGAIPSREVTVVLQPDATRRDGDAGVPVPWELRVEARTEWHRFTAELPDRWFRGVACGVRLCVRDAV